MGPAYSGVQNEKDNKERTGGSQNNQGCCSEGSFRRILFRHQKGSELGWCGSIQADYQVWGGYYLWSLGEIKRLQEYLPARMCITSVSPSIEIYADLD